MTRVKNYSITKESTDEMIAAGRFNPSLEIIFRDRHGTHRHKLSAGYADDIHVYREAGLTCVLSVNNGLGLHRHGSFRGKPAGRGYLSNRGNRWWKISSAALI